MKKLLTLCVLCVLGAKLTAAPLDNLKVDSATGAIVGQSNFWSGNAAALQAVAQPLDSDLTAIAALTTTSFGRGSLALTDGPAARTYYGLAIGTNVQAWDADLDTLATGIAGMRSLLSGGTGALNLSGFTLTLPTDVTRLGSSIDLATAVSGTLPGSGVQASGTGNAGVTVVATATEVQTGTNALKTVAPSALAAWWTWIKAQAQTIAGNWTFSGTTTIAGGAANNLTLAGTTTFSGSGTLDFSNYNLTFPSNLLIQFRRGTAAELAGVTLQSGEPGWITDTKVLTIGDGATAGGIEVLSRLGPNATAGAAGTGTAGAAGYESTKAFKIDARSGNGGAAGSNAAGGGGKGGALFSSGTSNLPIIEFKYGDGGAGSAGSGFGGPGGYFASSLFSINLGGGGSAPTVSGNGAPAGNFSAPNLFEFWAGFGGAGGTTAPGGTGGSTTVGFIYSRSGFGGSANGAFNGGNGGNSNFRISAQCYQGGDAGATGNGGSGGNIGNSITLYAGRGGAGSSSVGGNGGSGGNVGYLFNVSAGTGGDGGFGFNGGNAGGTGYPPLINAAAGSGGAGSALGAGANGGNGGYINLDGASAYQTTFGGAGGVIAGNGFLGFDAGSVRFSGNAVGKGGSINIVGAGNETASFGGGVFSLVTQATVANTTTATTLIGAGRTPGQSTTSTPSLSANALVPGASYKVRASGFYSTTVAPTAVLTLSLGGTTIAGSPAATLGTSVSNNSWSFDADFVCVTVGASGTVMTQAQANFMTAAGVVLPVPIVNTTATTLDTTTSKVINLQWTWSAASASNTATCTNLVITRTF